MRYNVSARIVTLIDAENPDEAVRNLRSRLDRIDAEMLDQIEAFESEEQPEPPNRPLNADELALMFSTIDAHRP